MKQYQEDSHGVLKWLLKSINGSINYAAYDGGSWIYTLGEETKKFNSLTTMFRSLDYNITDAGYKDGVFYYKREIRIKGE